MLHGPSSPLLGTAVAPSNSGSAGDTERGASAMGPVPTRGRGDLQSSLVEGRTGILQGSCRVLRVFDRFFNSV